MTDDSRGTDDDPPGEDADVPRLPGMSKSMHDGVSVSCDCCSCEAEPYWAELASPDSEVRPDAGAPRARE